MIGIEGYESKSNILVRIYVVSLANNDKKRCKAENIEIEDGALCGIIYDPDHVDRDDMMGQDIIWAFPPGAWKYVERDFEAEAIELEIEDEDEDEDEDGDESEK